MLRSYRALAPARRHVVSDGEVAFIVAALIIGVWLRRPLPVVAVGISATVVLRSPRVLLAACAVGIAGLGLSNRAWSATLPDELGPFRAWSCLAADPVPVDGALGVVVEVNGERFQGYLRGSARRRTEDHLAGECAVMSGERLALAPPPSARRAAIRHIVGRLAVHTVDDWRQGSALARASNRVRRLFELGAMRLPEPDRFLFAGLVIGDDRHEPQATIAEFRQSGLSHLTAVSGSNVAFVLAAAAPLLRRMRPWMRWTATCALIAWFVALTRFEPSILRAGVMAAIACTGHVLGRETPPGRVLLLAVGALVVVDPLLVWSVGFWLSVAATAGVALLSGPLSRLLPGPAWFSLPLAVTLGAQFAVGPVLLVVFGSMPIVSVPANLLAVPVAGFVMLYGLPAGLLAGAIGGTVGTIVQVPSAVGTRWVATVAGLAARVQPSPLATVVGWAAIGVVIGIRAWRAMCKGER